MNQYLYRTPPYDPINDFVPVTLVAKTMILMMVNSASEMKTVNDLIGKAKANPGKLNYGAGTISTKLLGFLLNKAAGISTVLVPYNGSAEVTQGLLTKSVDFTFDGPSAAASLIQSGQFRVLAKFDDRPFPPAPNAPMVQTAVPNLDQITVWLGLVAPKGTPPAIVAKLQQEVAKVLADPGDQGQGGRRRALSRDRHAGRVRGLHQGRSRALVEGRGRDRHEVRLKDLDDASAWQKRFVRIRVCEQEHLKRSVLPKILTSGCICHANDALLRRSKFPTAGTRSRTIFPSERQGILPCS